MSLPTAPRHPLLKLGTTLLALLAVLLLWHLLTAVWGVISAARFPNPLEVALALKQIAVEGYSNGRLHQHVLTSVLLVSMGFVVASGVASCSLVLLRSTPNIPNPGAFP